MGAVWDHSTGRGRNRVRLGGEKEGGIIVGEGEGDRGEERGGKSPKIAFCTGVLRYCLAPY